MRVEKQLAFLPDLHITDCLRYVIEERSGESDERVIELSTQSVLCWICGKKGGRGTLSVLYDYKMNTILSRLAQLLL